MNSLVARWLAIVAGVVIVALAIGLYVNKLVRSPTPVSAQVTGPGQAQLTLGTTPAVGKLGGHPTWVSYLVREGNQWKHTTTFDVPAHSLVHITILNFDGKSGMRNPFLSQVQGTVGGTMQLDGKTVKNISPDDASHTFTVPQLGDRRPDRGRRRRRARISARRCRARSARRTRRHLHDPHRQGGLVSAGSASCRARPASSPASAGRCRRSATWTASCTWSEPERRCPSPHTSDES